MVKLVLQKGGKNTNLDMLPEPERKAVLQEAVAALFRHGKNKEAFELLEQVDKEKFAEMAKSLASSFMESGDYRSALSLYERADDNEMASFIRENFLVKNQ